MTIIRRPLFTLLKALATLFVVVVAAAVFFSVWAMFRERETRESVAPENGHVVHAADVSLFYQTVGNPDDPPVILIHGMAAWSGTWRQTMDALAEAGWYAIAFDLPPFGFSERPSDRSYWRVSQATRILAAIDSLHIEKPILVAHSYGSRGALDAVLREEDVFKALVLVDSALDGIYDDTPASPGAIRFVLSLAPLRYAIVATTMTNPLLSRTLLKQFMHRDEAASRETLAVYAAPGVLKDSTQDMGLWLRGFISNEDRGLSSDRSMYARITLPTTIIWGEEDTTTPLSQGKQLAGYIRNASLIVLPDVGHIPHVENAPVFNTALLDALRPLQ